MDSITEIWTAWNEQWGATTATIVAVIALLKSTGKEIHQLGSTVWHWKGWTIVAKLYRQATILHRVRRAKNVMRRELEKKDVRIGITVYGNCLREDPSKSTRGKLQAITPAKPSWLNDYYVATALESLSNEERVVKVTRSSVKSWPPNPESYDFLAVTADRSACEEAVRIETNDKCVAYQFFGYCPRESRFERQEFAETVSARETRLKTTFPLKENAPPCELCWDQEYRDRDIRILVDKVTKYDLAEIATAEIIGTNGEFQKVVADTCIQSQCAAEAGLIRIVVKQAINVRQQQFARNTSRLQGEWRQSEKEELVAALKEYIKRQTVQ